MANSLLSKGTKMSELLGYETSITRAEVSGVLITSNLFVEEWTVWTELLLEACINLDMIFTLKNPFSRAKNLVRLK